MKRQEFSHHYFNSTSHSLIFFFLCLTQFFPQSNAMIKTFTISNAPDAYLDLDTFCFSGSTGYVSISLSSIEVHPNNPNLIDYSRIGFLISNPFDESTYYEDHDDDHDPDQDQNNRPRGMVMEHPKHFHSRYCSLDHPFHQKLFTFINISFPSQSSFNQTFRVFNTSIQPSTVAFVNCNAYSRVSMKVTIESYNLDSNGHKYYLSYYASHLPELLFYSGLFYISFFGLWTYVCKKNKQGTRKIHVIMGVLLLIKAMNLLFAAAEKQSIKITGKAHGWNIVVYFFHAIRSILVLIVIVLIGYGWSFLKKTLDEDAKEVLNIVIISQVVANAAHIIMFETIVLTFLFYLCVVSFFVFDATCCTFIVLDLMGLAQKKKTRFSLAYLVFIYMLIGRSLVYMRFGLSCAERWWLGDVMGEVNCLLFCMALFWMFKPSAHNNELLDDVRNEAEGLALVEVGEGDGHGSGNEDRATILDITDIEKDTLYEIFYDDEVTEEDELVGNHEP